MNQFNKIMNYLKDLLKKQNRKKLVENAAVAILAGIIIMIAAGSLFQKDSTKAKETAAAGTAAEGTSGNSSTADKDEKLERKMETILSKVDGAGRVSVMVTYVSSSELITAKDTKKTENNTQEKDNTGGTRTTSDNQVESSIIYEEGQDSTKKPLIVKTLEPEVKGVVVVADGAADVQVKERLSMAVHVLLGVSLNKIEVFESGK